MKGVKETKLTKNSTRRLHNSAHRCHTQHDICTTKTSSLRYIVGARLEQHTTLSIKFTSNNVHATHKK